jgi:arsenate reductase
MGEGRVHAYSAGSHPKGQVHPGAIALLKSKGYDVSGFRSKSWDEFSGPDAIRFDYVVTVCNNAAGEVCPIIPGKPAKAHWEIPDPPVADDVPKAFEEAYALISNHMTKFLAGIR